MYNERNGWVDTGKPVGSQRCWNCGSTTQYHQSVSLEKCNACGIECNYWGDGANAAYNNATDARHRAAEARRERELQKELDAMNYDPHYDSDYDY